MSKKTRKQIIPRDRIESKIHFLRDQRVLLSSDLAPLYAVPVRALVQAVKRNKSRFPADFMFQLTAEELKILKSQTVTSSWGGARRGRPYAFTEQGVAMLSSVLHSERAVQVNIAIMRAFLQLRAMMNTHQELRRKINEMEKRYDARFQAVFATLRQMLETPIPPKKQIGFHAGGEDKHRASPTRKPNHK
jgi:ORF6N domain